MEKNTLDRLKGKYCKIVIKEPGKQKSTVINGFLKEIDYDKNFLVVESEEGTGLISIESLVAIKPCKKT